MSFLDLPNELILLIATELNNLKDIHSLILTNRTFSSLLITNFYRIAARDQDRAMRALFYAAVHRNESLIRTLLEKTHGIAVMDVQPGFAKRISDTNIDIAIKAVLSQGVNLTLQPGFGRYHWHGLYWAVLMEDEPLIRLLLENGVAIDFEDTTGRTALNEAVCNGNKRITRLLLDHGANTANLDLYGRSLIDVASTYSHHEIIMIILKKRPDFFKVGGSSTLALHNAALHGDEELVRILLVHGVNPNIRGTGGRTALHIAAEAGHVKMAGVLVEGGATIDIPDSIYERTPLHIAIKEGHERIVRLLIENGADYMLMDKGGQNAATLAEKYKKNLLQALRTSVGSRVKNQH